MNYQISEIADILNVTIGKQSADHTIKAVSVDTRQISSASATLFFALPGTMSDGHKYVKNAFDSGVRNFVISKHEFVIDAEEANFLMVDNVLVALQKLATHHRTLFPNLTRIGITGSNGKTIVKEWLYQMLHDRFVIVKSPKSYNSQIGMALSLLTIEDYHEIGIFEAGISQKEEMKNHLKMLQPDIGIITNIGHAHSDGFDSDEEKTKEKLILFDSTDTIVYRQDFDLINDWVREEFAEKSLYRWSIDDTGEVNVTDHKIADQYRSITIQYKDQEYTIRFHMIDLASFENMMHCITLMLHLGVPPDELQSRINRVSGLKMRLEMQSGIHNSIIINDAYSADLDSFDRGVEFLKQHSPRRNKMAIVSAFDQSGMNEYDVFGAIVRSCEMFDVSELFYISDNEFEFDTKSVNVTFYKSKAAFLDDLQNLEIRNKGILIKGARKYKLEDVSRRLLQKSHSAVLSIDLNAIEHNLRIYKSYLKNDAGIIAVVKASAYGSGSEEVARLLENNNVDYLAVAFADEGVSLRLAGIKLPIMVLNPDMNSLAEIYKYRLEPEIYSLDQMKRLVDFSHKSDKELSIHIKLDTGMHRLGFQREDMIELASLIKNSVNIKVKTIFSHLASSEDSADDDYSQKQFKDFEAYYSIITDGLNYTPKRHILNTGGITRFPNQQYDYVRLGIGLYGIDQNQEVKGQLLKAHKFSASLIQIKQLKKGKSVGYNRKTVLDKDTKIGIVNIGYADGLIRNLGNRKYSFIINGKKAPILGNVCMDLTIVDLSLVPDPIVGDEVILFDNEHQIEDMATSAGTIAYEILSTVSGRVKRKFVRE